ncbi:MAG: PD40 domain-containing protein, partial [Candidatus Marinimicrobia bacterium]|nr:PD40 domain-containing protein [Candidatus Neomarinimicrobiota bacterium]
MKWKWFLYILILLSNIAIAQLAPNQKPPGIKWKKIQAEHFDVIVPEELTEEGQRVANTMEYLRDPLQKSLNVRMRKWQVLLSNRSAVSNGYVSLLPRRSEWFATPPQSDFSGTAEWYHLLAIHEGRHMAQFDKLNQGFTRFAGIFFGELGQGAFSFLSTPLWFMEGDAVAIETALSNSGRGRIPQFDMGIRTLLLSDQQYSYYKAYLGSYKDYYPNFYHLGYHLVTHGRRQYGVNVWNDIINRSAKHSYWPFTFSRSMKKITGRNAKGIYKDTMTELDSLWRQQIEELEFTMVKKLNTRKKRVWTNYKFPQILSDGSIIALLTGMADPHILIQIDLDGSEKRLIQIVPTDRISVNGGKITWCVNNTDRRWWAQSFSDVAVYDIKTKNKREITKEGKYFSPALSPDGQQIAAVKFTQERKCSLVILDSKTGEELIQFPNPDNFFIKTPFWSEDGKHLVYIRQKYRGKAL